MLLRRHRIQCKRTYYHKSLALYEYNEKCQLTETLLNGEVRNMIDTCTRDYCLVEKSLKKIKQSFLEVF